MLKHARLNDIDDLLTPEQREEKRMYYSVSLFAMVGKFAGSNAFSRESNILGGNPNSFVALCKLCKRNLFAPAVFRCIKVFGVLEALAQKAVAASHRLGFTSSQTMFGPEFFPCGGVQ